MLIIGHRGAAGLAPENTLQSLGVGYDQGVDILEFDVHLTKDGIPVLLSDSTLKRTHQLQAPVRSFTFTQLEKFMSTKRPATLDEVLDKYYGRILLNIELKSRGSGKAVIDVIRKRAGTTQSKWDNVLISSFKSAELIAVRRASRQANLALLHDLNPFAFITFQPFLDLTAVGFHRLHLNTLATEIAKKAGLFTYAYTVNRPDAARQLDAQGIDGVVSDRPDILAKALRS